MHLKEFKQIKLKTYQYQLGANIDHYFEKLIDNKMINFKNRKELWIYVETGTN